MLRVARVSDSTGRYYLADVAVELDAGIDTGPAATGPGRGPPASSRWTGRGAAALSLEGRVGADAFEAVLAGRHPQDRHQLRLRTSRVCAYDLTFAAPKSASVLFALGGPGVAAAVRSAHDRAVDAAMDYVATRAAAVRCTTAEGRTTAPVRGVVGAAFTHGVSRALDPHLHSHVVVANFAHGADDRWRSLDGRGLYAHAGAAGALYDAVLRDGISTRLGLDWVARSPRAWELSVVDPFVLAAFSGRRAEILSHLGARGRFTVPSRRAREVAWAATRAPKVEGLSGEAVVGRWRTIARDAGWPVDQVLAPPARDAGRRDIDEHRFAAAISDAGPRGIARRDAVRAWALSLPCGASGEQVALCVDSLADWGTGEGVGEPHLPPATVVPPSHVRQVLGPRPASPDALSVWQAAASSIGGYRARWDVRDPLRALGARTRAELSALPARRLADHLATSRAIDDALARLDRVREQDRTRGLEMSRGLFGGT